MATVTFIPRVCLDYELDDINLISIGEPEESSLFFLERFTNPPLRLQFDDIDQEIPGYKMFDFLMALRVVGWIRNLNPDQPVIVHCQAGVSRSAAVAKFMVDHLGYTLRKDPNSSNSFSFHNKLVYLELKSAHTGMMKRSNAYRERFSRGIIDVNAR